MMLVKAAAEVVIAPVQGHPGQSSSTTCPPVPRPNPPSGPQPPEPPIGGSGGGGCQPPGTMQCVSTGAGAGQVGSLTPTLICGCFVIIDPP